MNTENINNDIPDFKKINYSNDFDRYISFLEEKRSEV